MYLIGVDIGTTSLKVTVLDEAGNVVRNLQREYALITPSAEWVELEVSTYWVNFCSLIRELLEDINPSEIKAIGIDSQGETLICLDKDGEPLRNAIVWLDNRSSEESKTIEDKFGQERVFTITGQPEIIPTFPATKILWLKNKEPETFQKVHKYLLLKDYLIYKLTGSFSTEGSILSSSLLFNIIKRCWWTEVLDFIEITSSHLPEIMEPGEPAGKISRNVADELGLSTSTQVVHAGMDQTAGMVGAGNIEPGIVSETTGAALAICATLDKPVISKKYGIPCQYHSAKNKYLLQPWCPTAGMSLKWFRDKFCEGKTYDELTTMASNVGAGSEGLVLLPHLAGAGSPEFNPDARGVFFGFTLRHGREHFVRATIESIAFMIKTNLEVLEEMGIEAKEIRVLGGGAKSSLWNSIKADITAKPIVSLRNEECATSGSAILAGVAAGVYSSLEEAIGIVVKEKERFFPRKENEEIYKKAYKKYLEVYEKCFAKRS
jgi:xylulokinase